jgi:hypothetical protein
MTCAQCTDDYHVELGILAFREHQNNRFNRGDVNEDDVNEDDVDEDEDDEDDVPELVCDAYLSIRIWSWFLLVRNYIDHSIYCKKRQELIGQLYPIFTPLVKLIVLVILYIMKFPAWVKRKCQRAYNGLAHIVHNNWLFYFVQKIWLFYLIL